MRLNRVLLLAAVINLMIFAMVFTVSCSDGSDGKDGKNGKYDCEVVFNDENDEYVVSCNGDELGTFVGSAEGLKGDPGPDGEPGENGPMCWLGTKDAKGSYPILCGPWGGTGTVQGSLDACTNNETVNTHEVNIQCGSTAISLCDGKAYNPSEKFCDLNGGDPKDLHYKIGHYLAYCDKKPYYTDKQYCGFASEADYKAKPKKLSVLNICGDGILDNGTGVASSTTYHYPNDYNFNYVTVASGTEIDWSVDGTNVDAEGKGRWANEYCQYSYPKDIKGKVAVAEVCGDPVKAVKVTINKDSFKGEYCGWSSASAVFPSVLKGSCPTPTKPEDPNDAGWKVYRGPHEAYYNSGYCAYTRDNKVVFDANICEVSKHPNSSKWNGEYCGATKTSDGANIKVYTGVCDDGKGPNTDGWNESYCEYNRLTFKTETSSNFCESSQTTDNNNHTYSTSTGKPNEGSWKGEYCGCANKACEKQKMYSGLCDDGDGPNMGEFGKGYCRANSNDSTVLESNYCGKSGKINAGAWKGEYCGYADAESTENDTVYEGGCDDGFGPNSDGFASGYCKAGRDGKTEKTTVLCGEDGKPNDGAWKGEYCGFASESSTTNDKVWTGACDDGYGPNRDGFGAGYCAMDSETDSLTVFTNTYCDDGSKRNEGKWKGEYCFADGKVAACTGGLVALTGKLSTDPVSVRCVFADNPGCSAERPDLCDQEECLALKTDEIEYEFDGVCKEKASSEEVAAKRLAKRK